MKTLKITVLLLLLIPGKGSSQLSENYKSCLKSFYKLLYKENVAIIQ